MYKAVKTFFWHRRNGIVFRKNLPQMTEQDEALRYKPRTYTSTYTNYLNNDWDKGKCIEQNSYFLAQMEPQEPDKII